MSKKLMHTLLAGRRLSREEATDLARSMIELELSTSQIASALTALQLRPITAEELGGFLAVLREHASRISLGKDLLDLCGTGGDGHSTFNISTAAAFAAAACGVKVAKHGNYAASSKVGSSNVLEALGVPLLNNARAARESLDALNLTFLHAPLFHPVLKGIAGVRKELGFRTIFNLLGPLLNPAKPTFQVIGVYSAEVARVYRQVLQESEHPPQFVLVHSLGGYDEISLTGPVHIWTAHWEAELWPADLGCSTVTPEDLLGADTAEGAAHELREVLGGGGTEARRNVVSANAGLALWLSRSGARTLSLSDLSSAIAEVRLSLIHGAAGRIIERLKDQ